MEPERLNYFQGMLEKKQEDLVKLINNMNEDGLGQSMKDSIGELSLIDNHPGDVGSEVFERSKDLALKDNALIQLEKVKKALSSVKNGDFGICQDCLQPIEIERLEAMPEATECLACREVSEGRGNRNPRPVEEELVMPPFNQPLADDYNFFDGEDAWQGVARYGTSETPSDIGRGNAQYPNVYIDWDEDRDAVEDVDQIPYTIEENSIIVKDYGKGEQRKH